LLSLRSSGKSPIEDPRYWHVFRAGPKIVTYAHGSDRDEPGEVQVFDSLEAIEPHVPPEIFHEAAVKAGLREESGYPEIPLEL
jgi:hypothetical protein